MKKFVAALILVFVLTISTAFATTTDYQRGYRDGYKAGYADALQEEEHASFSLMVDAKSVNARANPGIDAPSKKVLHRGDVIVATSMSFVAADGRCWIGAVIDGKELYVSMRYLVPVEGSQLYAAGTVRGYNTPFGQKVRRYTDEWLTIEAISQVEGEWFIQTPDGAWVNMKDLSL